MKPYRFVPTFVLLAAIPLFAPNASAATECKAEIRVTAGSDQLTDRNITKVWGVDVETQEACAKVYVDAVLTERLFTGEEITSTRRGSRKVTNQNSTFKVNYRIAPDSTLVNASFKVARCVVCGTE